MIALNGFRANAPQRERKNRKYDELYIEGSDF